MFEQARFHTCMAILMTADRKTTADTRWIDGVANPPGRVPYSRRLLVSIRDRSLRTWYSRMKDLESRTLVGRGRLYAQRRYHSIQPIEQTGMVRSTRPHTTAASMSPIRARVSCWSSKSTCSLRRIDFGACKRRQLAMVWLGQTLNTISAVAVRNTPHTVVNIVYNRAPRMRSAIHREAGDVKRRAA